MIYRWCNDDRVAIQAINEAGQVFIFEPGQPEWENLDKSLVDDPAPVPKKPLPPATVEDVKEEAYKRIVAILPEWKQRNLTARAAELAAILAERSWTNEERAEWGDGQAIWDQIKAIRAASNEIEAMDPIPVDFREDRYWSG